jgi:Amt family ammonium transporter
VLVAPALGGTGLIDYVVKPGEAAPGEYVMAVQCYTQVKAVALTLVWSGVVSAVLYKLVDILVGLRPEEQREREGLDLTEHGERAYNY